MSASRVIGVVPARSGSKGIPGKNIRVLAGKPLLGRAIEGGLQSGALDQVLLLTDSQEYAEIGKQHGAVVPFLRPAELSTDTSPVVDVLVWLTKELAARGEKPDYMVLLEPTAPGRQSKHIKELVELVAGNGADSGFTVMPVPPGHNAHWQFALDASNKPSIVTGEPVSQIIRRRQELPPLYVRGGSTYIFHTDLLLLEQPTLYGDSVRVLPIDPKYSVDLDTEEDWQEAEKIIPTLN